MERRSRRGRTSLDTTDPLSVESPSPPRSTPKAGSSSSFKGKSVEVPEPASEEVVLNARGMPARQRKRNRFYYDEDVMVTPESMARLKGKAYLKKVKPEPVEVEEVVEDDPFVTNEYADETLEEEEEEEVEEEFVTEIPDPSPPPVVKSPKKTPRSRRSENTATARPRVKGQIKIAAAQRKVKLPPPPTEEPTDNHEKADSDLEEYENSYIFNTTPKTKKKESPRGSGPKKGKAATSPRIKKEPGSPHTPVRARVERDRETEKDRQYLERDRQAREQELQDEQIEMENNKREARRERAERLKMERDAYTVIKPRPRRDSSSPNQQYDLNNLTADMLPPETTRGGLDKKTAHDISIRLRNLLKLPKAHKWVCYEWFYSNIDKVLFEGENDFQICLKESFPQLKARKMSRVEWCKIRRLMGKPRRCSQAFFDEEREELARRRQKIRMIQQRKVTDFNYKELPDEIPLQLVIGTKVTSRLRKPQDGLFTGTIEGVDTSNNTYRITFDRPGLGTHSIPDYEVLSNEPPETVSTSSFALKIPRRNYGFSGGNFKFQNPNLMGEDMAGFPKSPFPVDGMLGGFPIRLLDMIVRLSKLLKAKREKILQLKELNVEAEKLRSYEKNFNDDYRTRYARCVLDLESMNKEMSMYLDGIQQYCLEIAPDHGSNQMIVPEHIQESCRQEALLIVDTYNTKQNRSLVHGSKSLSLIANLTSLMLQVKALSAGDRNLYELKSIKDSLRDIKASLEGRNVQLFQDRIEIPMNRVQAGLTMSLPNLRNTY